MDCADDEGQDYDGIWWTMLLDDDHDDGWLMVTIDGHDGDGDDEGNDADRDYDCIWPW